MSPIDWAIRPFKKYADFSGRAPRAEFWWFILLVCVAAVIATVIENALSLGPVVWVYGPIMAVLVVATFLPNLAVQVRRLHDVGRTGWWLLLLWIPNFVYTLFAAATLSGVEAGEMPQMGAAGVVLLLGLISLIGAIVLIVFFATAGTKGPNKYGEDPYGGDVAMPRT